MMVAALPGRRAMHARAVVATARAGGQTILPVLRSAPPLTLRQTGPHTVHLVSTAAGPLGGDRFELELDVAPHTRLEVGSIAGTLVLPGRGESLSVITARVGEGATLSFAPEPTVLAAGCSHRMVVLLSLAEGARVRWREEIVFGRYGEAPGRCHARFDATVEGRPLLRQEFAVGDPAFDSSPAVYGSARCVGTLFLAAPPLPPSAPPPAGAEAPPSGKAPPPARGEAPPSEEALPPARGEALLLTRGEVPPGHREGVGPPRGNAVVGEGVAVLPLAGPGTLVSALAADAVELRRRLEWGEAQATW
ncbi:urease accessory protein UreD [Nonomuraea sp. NPDC049152]|uniref:urease accessory protein UreD n=1 Tax=Nonomuraea sp. NPDC049152 TaxID=3154350 RepID=UPI0033D92CB8